MTRTIFAVIDRMIPDEGVEGTRERLRVRSIVGGSLMVVALTLAYVATAAATGLPIEPALTVLCLASFGLVPVTLRLWGPRAAGAHFLLASTLCILMVVVHGGGMRSEGLPWLYVLPGLYLLVAGARGGLMGYGISVAIFLGLAALDGTTWIPGTVVPEEQLLSVRVQTNIWVGACILAALYLRENAYSKAASMAIARKRALRESEAISAAKSAFLQTMSHEVRTPLHGVLSSVELMRAGSLAAEAKDHLGVIEASGKTLLSILNDMLHAAEADTSEIELEHSPVSPVKLVGDTLQLLEKSAASKGLILKVSASDLPEFASLDEGRVRHILMHLVGNAVKFTEQGSVVVRHRWDDGQWSLEVEDTGIGIEPSRLKAIFAPFVQGDGSMTRKYGGSGLGLAIARSLVEAMDGEIELDSTPGKGTIARFRIPAPRADAPQQASQRPQADTGRKLRILVVEDNFINQRVVCAVLERMGHEVHVVDDGEKAVRMGHEGPWDLVLMDLQMPVMDGFEATRRLRADRATAQLRIVALTANTFEKDRREAEAAGMDGFLTKPLDLAKLKDELELAARVA